MKPKKVHDWPMVMNNRMELVVLIAEKSGWKYIDYQENIGMISFIKGSDRINVYLSKMTLSTSVTHPKNGKTQLFRRYITEQECREIFKNPRQHTNKGYYRK